jgi:hypothetical protein
MTISYLPTSKVRDQLRLWAEHWDRPELAALADRMHRQTRRKQAPVSSVRMTPELRDKIRHYVKQNPDTVLSEVAKTFGVNSGRISETINYKRG